MPVPAPLSPDEINTVFVDRPEAPDNTFELALVLGGTVSAGAYTAGALDFLFEALDQWTTTRDAGNLDAPRHRLQIRVIAGTSGGGVNAAIAARALGWNYPPVSRGVLPQGPSLPGYGPLTGNPFYDVWCSMLQLGGFLGTDDLGRTPAKSVLNGKPIDDSSAYIAGFSTDNAAKWRRYLGEPKQNAPLRLILTMTNLQGIPYRTVFTPPVLGEVFVDHADHARFAVAYWNQEPFIPRPNEAVLGFDPGKRWEQAIAWDEFAKYAKATAAFPLGFPARDLNRRLSDYRYRVAVLPADATGSIGIRALVPDWDQFAAGGDVPAVYQFSCVDGGAIDNEPIFLARTELCGVKGRNPRNAATANRGVLLIDPFAGEAQLGTGKSDLFAVAMGTLNTLLQQTRYDSADIAMAADPEIYSRFMISGMRDGVIGSKALATGGLGAFIGFAAPAFMRHDYLLGRANCQSVLKTLFVVDAENPVVKGMWDPEHIKRWGIADGGRTLVPLIPLMGTAAVTETTDPWPIGALRPDAYSDLIELRWKALLASETQGSWWTKLAGWLGGVVTEGSIAGYARTQITTALTDWKLLSR